MKRIYLVLGLTVLAASPPGVLSVAGGADHLRGGAEDPSAGRAAPDGSTRYAPPQADLFAVDYPRLVSRADLIYESPATHPVEGQPIGNGTMGTMVWTTADAVRFQINRTDVFATNKGHTGPDAWRAAGRGPVDYGGSQQLVHVVPRFRAALAGASLNTAIRTPLAAVQTS